MTTPKNKSTKKTNTRKELRTTTDTPTVSSVAKVVSRGKTPATASTVHTPVRAVPQPRPPLRRTPAIKSGLSTLAKKAVDRHKAGQAPAETTTVSAEPLPEPVGEQTVPVPSVLAQAPAETGAKTKRQQLDLTASLTNPELARLNAESNRAALEKIYNVFYADGVRTNADEALEKQLVKLYWIMGKGSADYVNKPVTDAEFQNFMATPKSEITAQGKSVSINKRYQRRKKRWDQAIAAWQKLPETTRGPEPSEPRRPPQTFKEAVARGDYFHVYNRSGNWKEEDLSGRARRIIVNVNSQQAGLKVAKSMSGLFDDPVVSPHLRQYKIFLTQAEPTASTGVKHDKLVIYYSLATDATEDDDEVGDRIVAAIKGSIDSGDVGGEFAPFYARVGPGIAWAEEPKYFVDTLKGSFTESREQIVANVIKDAQNQNVKDLDTFVGLVSKALQDNWVDPVNPHRHLPGKLPQPKRPKAPARPATASTRPLPAPKRATASPKPVAKPATASKKPVAKVSTTTPLRPLPPLPKPTTPATTGT